MLKNSYSISYIENLLLQSYSSIYDAVVGENNSINNNTELRLNNFSIDQSLYLYKLDKIQFYKNINTFLFYFYFIFLIIFIILIFNYNTKNNLIKLVFFRVFIIILILYPFFILRFENLFYVSFNNLIYLNITSDYDNNEYKEINHLSNGNSLFGNIGSFKNMFDTIYYYYYKISNYIINFM